MKSTASAFRRVSVVSLGVVNDIVNTVYAVSRHLGRVPN